MRTCRVVVFLAGLIILIGCGSKVPIADVSDAITDDRVAGFWITDTMDNEQMKMLVLRFNEKEYFIHTLNTKLSGGESKDDTLFCRAYITMVGEKPFMNVQPMDTTRIENRNYFFFDYQFSGDSIMTVRGLDKVDSVSVNDFKTSEDLFSFILEYMNSPDLYDEPIRFIRKY